MPVAIMQPYFFPYLGHFALIAHSDLWIVFDIAQYTPKSWISRNRILHPNGGWQYVSVPLARSSIHMRTSEAIVADPEAALSSVLGRLSHYRRRAPFYQNVIGLVREAFGCRANSLVQLNVSALSAVCRYLDLPFTYQICSQLDLALPTAMAPGDWAPAICTALDIKQYLNPLGGAALFNPNQFHRLNIGLQFSSMRPLEYNTRGLDFVPDLSILDVLMWNEPNQVLRYIRSNTHVVSSTSILLEAVQAKAAA